MGEVIDGNTLAKIAANRENALRSTGPKTPEGKRRSAHNARKHGLLAKAVVLEVVGESGKEFKTLLKGLFAHLQPAGPLEEVLVERIATCVWKLRRLQRVESAEVGNHLQSRRLRSRSVSHRSHEEAIRYMLGETDLRDTAAGIKELLDLLLLIDMHVMKFGHVPENFHAELLEKLGDAENGCAAAVIQTSAVARGVSAENQPFYKKSIHAMIAREKAYLERLRKERFQEERERQLEEQKEEREPLLPEDSLGKYLRYETAYERQLYKAIDQLERLQRQRKGDFVPPPLNVQVSTDSQPL